MKTHSWCKLTSKSWKGLRTIDFKNFAPIRHQAALESKSLRSNDQRSTKKGENYGSDFKSCLYCEEFAAICSISKFPEINIFLNMGLSKLLFGFIFPFSWYIGGYYETGKKKKVL